jgi:D-amino-acid dehydrogenase
LHALVIGAGVIGVTTAHSLHKEGYDVTVVEAAADAGLKASNVNAGLLVPADSTIWPHPGAPGQVLSAILHPDHGALRINRAALPGLTRWGLHFIAACRRSTWKANSGASLALSRYSYPHLQALLEGERLQIDHTRHGMLFLSNSKTDLDACLKAHSVLQALGEEYRILSPSELVALDSGYAVAATDLAGAVHAPSSGSGDCGAFTRLLAHRLSEQGVGFLFGTAVRSLLVRERRAIAVATDRGEIAADLIVACGGAASAGIVGGHLRLPMVPARGYSVTLPVIDPTRAPRIGGVDERTHVAFSRLGDRLRATSTAEIGFKARRPGPTDYADIRLTIERLFPGACDWERATYDFGDRPMMPKDLPVIGPTPIAGLFLNTGHGHLGWTQACGSARLLGDLVTGRKPAIDPEPYRLTA